MAFLKSILTYSVPSEAEVDKSLLEANGFTVNLLNAEVTRMQLGPGFNIQLQVPDDEVQEAIALLRSLRPERFGSAENVRKIEKGLRQSTAWAAIVGVASTGVLFLVQAGMEPLSLRIAVAAGQGVFVGVVGWILWSFFRGGGPDR